MRASRLILSLVLILATPACSAVDIARGESGLDVSGIQPGITRAEVENLLGTPQRTWVSEQGIRYATYEFDAGVAGEGAGGAAAAIFMDVATVGVWELFWPSMKKDQPRTTGRVVISYDDRDVVLGLFDEFDELPPDGRSEMRPAVLGP